MSFIFPLVQGLGKGEEEQGVWEGSGYPKNLFGLFLGDNLQRLK